MSSVATSSEAAAIHYRAHEDPASSHQQILAAARELAALGRSPMLDVGAAQGMFGQAMRAAGVVMDGVEPNEKWADMARPFYRTIWTSFIEAAPLPEKTYRVVICGDVLEHLPDPVGALKKVSAAATDDATFIISVPNVAHLAIRLMLLFGKFPKMERGILDRTHLQYLTRDTATQMLAAAGLGVERASVSGVPIDELWKGGVGSAPFRALVSTQHFFLRILPRVFGYQWIFVARKIAPRGET